MPSRALLDIQKIRELAAGRVEATSLRAAAAEMGLSKTVLEEFLQGREPYAKTRPKLMEWYLRVREVSAISTEELDSAVSIIRRYVDAGGPVRLRAKRIASVTDRLFGND